MTADDFDKIDDDDDFASEFDFVEEDSAKGNGSGPTPSQQPSGDKPPSAALKLVLGVITLVGLGYFGYSHFSSDSAEKPAAADTAQIATDQAAPLPTPGTPEGESTAQAPEMMNQQDQDAVDFSEAFRTAESNAVPVTQTTDKISTAVPTKTFEQVQRDLKGNKGPAPTAIPDAINATLDSLSEEMTINVNQIKQLETTIATLATTVEQLNRTVSAMDNRILSLTEIADNLAQDLNNVKKVMVAEDLDLTNPSSLKYTAKKQAQPISNNSASYNVHAIIPGRAWLKSSNGQIITVTEGDKIGDYGTIAVIDATNGVVRTSSGITFR